MGNVHRLFELARSELKFLLLGTVFLLIASGLNLSFPLLIGRLVDGISEGGGQDVVNHYVSMLLLVFALVGGATFLRAYLFTVAGERIVAQLQAELFKSILNQEIGFFDERKTGELTNRLAADTTVLQKAVTVNISMGLRFLLSALGSIAILMWTSWKLTLLMLAVVPIVAVAAGIYGRMLRKISKNVQDSLAEATAIAEETISGVRTVRAFAREDTEIQRYRSAVEYAFSLAKKRAFLGATFQGLISFAGYGAIGAVLWYGGSLLAEGEMGYGELTSFMLYTFTVAFSIGALSGLYEDFAKSLGASERVFELIDRDSTIINGSQTPKEIGGSLSFESVFFAYPTRPDALVLNGLTLKLDPGAVVALVGPSGGGKSTVAALASRLYDPQNGNILLDGVPLKEWDKDWLRAQIGVVAQEPILFATSIADNIRYGRPTASWEELVEAAKAANAHEFIEAFPNGYKTMVGERGIRLSGGQKQRVAIARALLKDPKVLILDEATSALDAQSEHLVQEALERLMSGRTTLVIAHRLSTIQDADRVAVLNDGLVVEEGTHEQLVDLKGLYCRLVERQFSA
ncbi:MAG: ABC transporter permease [Proteobacteria bacterium]|nr:ABC transporter permease [Pseudomonadota bacterium]